MADEEGLAPPKSPPDLVPEHDAVDDRAFDALPIFLHLEHERAPRKRRLRRLLLWQASVLVCFGLVSICLAIWTNYWSAVFSAYAEIGRGIASAWRWSAAHKDLLVFSADLLSFLLVTPEIVRRFATSAVLQRFVTTFILFYFLLVFLGITALGIHSFFAAQPRLPLWRLILSLCITLPIDTGLAVLWYKSVFGKG